MTLKAHVIRKTSIPRSSTGTLNIKMTILPKANYQLNAIHIKIPVFLAEIKKKNPFSNSCGITRDPPLVVKTIFLKRGGEKMKSYSS